MEVAPHYTIKVQIAPRLNEILDNGKYFFLFLFAPMRAGVSAR